MPEENELVRAAGPSHLPMPLLPDKVRRKFRYKREQAGCVHIIRAAHTSSLPHSPCRKTGSVARSRESRGEGQRDGQILWLQIYLICSRRQIQAALAWQAVVRLFCPKPASRLRNTRWITARTGSRSCRISIRKSPGHFQTAEISRRGFGRRAGRFRERTQDYLPAHKSSPSCWREWRHAI